MTAYKEELSDLSKSTISVERGNMKIKLITGLFLITSLTGCNLFQSSGLTEGTVLSHSLDFRGINCMDLNQGSVGQSITTNVCHKGDIQLPEIGSRIQVKYVTGATYYGIKIKSIKILQGRP